MVNIMTLITEGIFFHSFSREDSNDYFNKNGSLYVTCLTATLFVLGIVSLCSFKVICDLKLCFFTRMQLAPVSVEKMLASPLTPCCPPHRRACSQLSLWQKGQDARARLRGSQASEFSTVLMFPHVVLLITSFS